MNNITKIGIKAFSVALLISLLATASAAATTVSIADTVVGSGGVVTLPIMISNITNYGMGTMDIRYNSSVVHVTDVTSSSDSNVVTKNIDNTAGVTRILASNTGGVSGNIVFANAKFMAVGVPGSVTSLNIDVIELCDTSYNDIPANISDGSITVSDLDLYPCSIDFSPAWMSNATDITVRLFNNGTGDACNFTLNVTMTSDCATNWANITNTSVCANAYKNITVTSPPLLHCCNYTVNVTLDPENKIIESNETNNTATKRFRAIRVKLKVTHHYGNMTAYNGTLSGNKSVVMFELYKNVTNYITPYELLTSEVDVLLLSDGFNISGINRSYASSPGMSTWYLNRSVGGEDPECPEYRPIYWYLFMNGVPTPNMPERMYDYTLSCGEVVHMDLLKYINSGNDTSQFKPRPIMDFPEPFKRGYNGTFNDTTIVYPSADPSYLPIATAIQSNLVNNCSTHCVNLAGHVHIHTDVTVGNRKNTDHLLLIGTTQNNNLIAFANANHTEIGMPMYYDSDGCIDDWLYPDCCSKKNSSYHRVVMACDNPFDNANTTDSWKDTNLTMWIASGVTDCYAKDAAEMLTIGCTQPLWDDKRFWNKSRASSGGNDGCGDIDGDCIPGTINDAIAIVFATPPAISLWAADVDCDCVPGTINDAIAIVFANLNCCDECPCNI
ncbi:MAG: hypothetical protein C4B59_00860 [Candidatus Methanogaster sp.]|uniref:Uncharacterized protein n=1 Tax=Candidatus Methanogaster sp. TaxID=3386292 RepID=A0AC61L761_9EURY|nr:MAG: hypothetical protein C4B59_00860 [ANME-2 cluster archaeon]